MKKSKINNYTVHEHLEHWVKKTTYVQRLKWLEEAIGFNRLLKKAKIIKN